MPLPFPYVFLLTFVPPSAQVVGSRPVVWAINEQSDPKLHGKALYRAESSLKEYLFSKIVSEVIMTVIVIVIIIIKIVTLKGVT